MLGRPGVIGNVVNGEKQPGGMLLGVAECLPAPRHRLRQVEGFGELAGVFIGAPLLVFGCGDGQALDARQLHLLWRAMGLQLSAGIRAVACAQDLMAIDHLLHRLLQTRAVQASIEAQHRAQVIKGPAAQRFSRQEAPLRLRQRPVLAVVEHGGDNRQAPAVDALLGQALAKDLLLVRGQGCQPLRNLQESLLRHRTHPYISISANRRCISSRASSVDGPWGFSICSASAAIVGFWNRLRSSSLTPKRLSTCVIKRMANNE